MALRGHVDRPSHREVIGRAWDAAARETPVALVVPVDGRAVGRCLAALSRDDPVEAGEGHGRRGFASAFPDGAVPALARCEVAETPEDLARRSRRCARTRV